MCNIVPINTHILPRGGKASDFEGGVRASAFVSGGILTAGQRGTKLDGTIAIADLHATICAIAGVPIADTGRYAQGLPAVDGVSMLAYLTGAVAASPRTGRHWYWYR
jgi:arylsulfatase I/J